MPKKGTSKKAAKEIEEDIAEPAAPAAESSEDDLPPPPRSQKKGGFAAALLDSDDDDDDEPQEDGMDFGKKKKKKEKKDKDENGGAKEKKAKKDKDDDGDGKKEKKEKKKKRKPEPLVCEILEIKPVPKKDKLRICELGVGEFGKVSVVTNAPNIVAGKKFIVALPGVTTANGIEVNESKVGGVESIGMLCGPKEMGWDTDVLDEKLAVQLDDAAEPGTSVPSYDDAVAALKEREKAAAAAAAASAPAPKADAKGKKGKKKGGAAKEDDEDLDALLEEFKEEPPKEAPKAEPAKAEPAKEETANPKAAANKKKKDKKKGAKGGDDDDDEFEAALNEAKAVNQDTTAVVPEESTGPKATQKDLEAPAEEEKNEEAVDAKTLANRAKKMKKKAKQSGGEGLWGDDDKEAAPEADAPAEAASSSAAPPPAAKAEPKKGGKAVKESAAVKAARERMEAQKKLEEEKAAFEAEQRRLVEEEERREREEEEKREAERQRKRDAKAEKIRRQKEEGTFMTKQAKQRAARAAELRKMFGLGDEEDKDEDEAEEQPKPARKPMASKLKKRPQKKTEDEQNEEDQKDKEEEEEKKVEPEPVKKEEPKAEPKPPADEDDGDDWEAEAEKAQEEAKKAEEKKDESDAESDKDDDESDDGSGSGSDSDSDSGSDSGSDSDSSSDIEYRSPIICIMGHVDTGKTKLLDKIRKTNVQEGEAGGITQQIGATFFPDIALHEQTKKVDPDFDLEVPGLLIIDTPGHESFNNLRTRGASLCDMAILVIDIMHGLEPQTVESLELLKKRRCPFIIAMNKIDVCYQWSSKTYTGVRDALDRQEQFVRDEFYKRFQNIVLQLNERGLNVALYWENEEPRSTVSIVPTSALTGEGVPDLLYTLLNLTQRLLSSRIEVIDELECTVIEVKNIEGLGCTIDVVLKNGTLREGDQIVIAGVNEPIVTTIRALVTPQPMKEMRVKNEYVHHKMINKSMGVKICAPGLDEAVAGTELKVIGPDDDVEDLKEEVMENFDSILSGFEKQNEGVYVKASTLGSLEALLSFLETDMKIPVFEVGIGEVHKKDVKKAMVMKEKSHPEYAVILAFDVPVNKEAKIQADKDDVQIMTADIIYHLQEKFKTYMDKVLESRKVETRQEVVFPVLLKIDKACVFRKKDPLIVGCDIIAGQLRIGTPLCIPERENVEIGRVGSIERDHKPVTIARRGERVCVKIEQNTAQSHITIGRHFDVTNQIYSKISRQSIDTLKENFRDEMQKEDWELVKGMKLVFNIQ